MFLKCDKCEYLVRPGEDDVFRRDLCECCRIKNLLAINKFNNLAYIRRLKRQLAEEERRAKSILMIQYEYERNITKNS